MYIKNSAGFGVNWLVYKIVGPEMFVCVQIAKVSAQQGFKCNLKMYLLSFVW